MKATKQKKVKPTRAEAAATVEFHHEEAAKVRESAQLRSINLIASSFFVGPHFFTRMRTESPPDLGFGVEIADVSFDADSGHANAFFDWHVWATDDGVVPSAGTATPESTHLHCTGRYFLGYSNLQGRDAHAVEHFVRDVGEFATYPYFRAFCAIVASAANIVLPPLPVITGGRRAPRIGRPIPPTGEPKAEATKKARRKK